MGGFPGKFLKGKSTIETLEEIEISIKHLEQYNVNAESRHRLFVNYLIIISSVSYILFGIAIYYYFMPKTWIERVWYGVALTSIPVLVLSLKKAINWYFTRAILQNQTRLSELRLKKRKILEEVMERETYKVARQLLEKYSDKYPIPGIAQNLRQRPNAIITTASTGTESSSVELNQVNLSQDSNQSQQSSVSGAASAAKLLPRPVISPNRSVFDKVLDYLVADGPSHRFAMICKDCHHHNGMALQEEFEYLAFRCVFCKAYNPARKCRPSAPPLTNAQMNEVSGEPTLRMEAEEVFEKKEEDLNITQNAEEDHALMLD